MLPIDLHFKNKPTDYLNMLHFQTFAARVVIISWILYTFDSFLLVSKLFAQSFADSFFREEISILVLRPIRSSEHVLVFV